MAEQPDHLALHGPTMTLRIPGPADATALFRLASDPAVTQWFSWGPYQETAEARAYLDRLPDQRAHATQLDLLELHRLSAYANPLNGRSVRALEKVGFKQEGLLRGWHRHGDAQLDVHVYGMLRDDWEHGPLAGIPVRFEGDVPPEFLRRLQLA